MPRPKTIFIDWSQTLSNSLFWENQSYLPQIQATLFTNKLLLSEWGMGQITAEKVVGKIAYQLELNFNDLLSALQISCEHMAYSSPHIPNQIATLRANGVRVVIATDNFDTFSRWTVPALRLNLLFDTILDSYSLQASKNDFSPTGASLFFGNFFSTHKLTYSDCLLIDDSPKTIKLYTQLGMAGLLVTPEQSLSTHLCQLLTTIT